MKKMYYYVPPCPNCGSRRTGRYMKYHRFMGTEYTEAASLKNGEIIRFNDEVPYRNAFCEDCGYEWHQYITGKWMSKDERIEEKHVRGTIPEYEAYRRSKKRPGFLVRMIKGAL